MYLSQSQAYIASNPRFAVTQQSRPKIQEVGWPSSTCALDTFGSVDFLEHLVRECISPNYESTFKTLNTEICKSILYHLNLLQESDLVREVASI